VLEKPISITQPTAPASKPETPKKQKTKWEEFRKNVWDIVKFSAIALAIVIPFRMYIAQPYIVSGVSMVPTFLDGQYIIVDEISYIAGNPHRGDVVIFRYPNDPSRFFIKRIIGLPNEKINIKDGKITIINDTNPQGFSLEEPYLNEQFHTTDNYTTEEDEYFVMGDNRNLSADSRVWGILPRKLMVGRAFLRLLPIKTISYLPGATEYK
jgi:signal peptidase I